jgi:hypothetical protein
LHEQGTYHGNLSCDKILIVDSGDLKITEFCDVNSLLEEFANENRNYKQKESSKVEWLVSKDEKLRK